jgi:hypothetical protein
MIRVVGTYRKNNIRLLFYLANFFLESEMFHKENQSTRL